jgi:hypothetical protein
MNLLRILKRLQTAAEIDGVAIDDATRLRALALVNSLIKAKPEEIEFLAESAGVLVKEADAKVRALAPQLSGVKNTEETQKLADLLFHEAVIKPAASSAPVKLRGAKWGRNTAVGRKRNADIQRDDVCRMATEIRARAKTNLTANSLAILIWKRWPTKPDGKRARGKSTIRGDLAVLERDGRIAPLK